MKNKMLLWMLMIAFTFAQSAFATDYYFSSVNGNDANNGLSSGAPKASESALQTVLNSLSAGDNVYLERGSVWYDIDLSISSKNGSSGSHITLTSYGTGDLPKLISMKELGTFTDEGSNIWSITDTDLPSNYSNTFNFVNGDHYPYYNDLNFLIIDGVSYAMGIEPDDNTYRSFESVNADDQTSAKDDQATEANDYWNGAHMKVGVQDWILDDVRVNDFASGTYYFNTSDWSNVGGKLSNHNGSYRWIKYFFANSIQTLDQNGEWCYDNSNQEIHVYWSGSLNSSDVYQSYENYCLQLSACSYIDISNIEFQGAIMNTVKLSSCTDMTVTDCIFKNTPRKGIWIDYCTNVTLSNNEFNHGVSIGIFNSFSRNVLIEDNTINNMGCYPSMGGDSDGDNKLGIKDDRRKGITTIQRNVIDSTGYSGINSTGLYSGQYYTPTVPAHMYIKDNDISNYCLTMTDGGGIYVFGDSAEYESSTTYKQISGNIVTNGFSNVGLAASNGTITAGIYVDGEDRNYNVFDNSVHYADIGLYTHGTTSTTLRRNNVYDVGHVKSSRTGFLGHSSGYGHAGSADINAVIKENQIVLCDSISAGGTWLYGSTFTSSGSVSDSNYYYHPYRADNLIMQQIVSWGDPTRISLSSWQSITGFDTHSSYNYNGESYSSGLGIAEDQFVKFLVNRDHNNSRIVDLHSCTFEDVDGNSVSGSVTVPTRSSKFLFYKTGNADSLALIIPDPEFVPSAPTSYYLTVSYAGTGSGSVSPGSGYYPIDTTLSLTATPNTGSIFAGWSGDTTATTNPLSVVMWKSKNLTATFTDTTTTTEDTIAMINFTYSGYTASGWTTIAGGSTFNVDLGDGVYISTSDNLSAGVNGEPSTIYPTNVGSTYHFINTSDNTAKHYTVSGLNSSKTYAFDFFESRDDGSASGDRTTTYTIGVQSAGVNPIGNTSTLATIEDVSPDGSGEVEITVTKISGQYGYINALIIREFTAGEPDPTVTISATDDTATEASETTGTIRVSRGTESSGNLTVNFSTGGTATLSTDYTLSSSSSVTITDGNTYADITVTPDDDAIDEDDETVILTLSSGSGYTIGTPSSATVTITDNDEAESDTIAYWRFENNAYDEMGNHNATLYGSPTYETSPAEGTYNVSFDGSGRYANCGSIELGSSFSISGYYKIWGVSGTRPLFATTTSSSPDGIYATVNLSTGVLSLITGNGSSSATATSTTGNHSSGSWIKYEFIVDCAANTCSIYIDDEDESSSTTIVGDFTDNKTFYIGCDASTNTLMWGRADAVMIVSDDLSRARIRSGELVDNDLKAISYYPVPVTDQLNLRNVPAKSLITIYDIVGSKIYERRNGSGTDLKVDMSAFKSGMYIFRVVDQASMAMNTFRVIKR